MISTRSLELVIDTVVCLTLAKWETVSGQFGGYLSRNFQSTTLVSRFRSSQALAAHSRANFGIKGTLALMTLVWFLDLKFLYEFAANALVSRFRSSQALAVHSVANFGRSRRLTQFRCRV